MDKIAGLSHLPHRAKELQSCIDSLLPQMDHIYIYCKDKASCKIQDKKVTLIDANIDNDRGGDAGKFYMLGEVYGYYFSCDDDQVYPADYADRMIAKIEEYDRKAVIGLHGVILTKSPHDRGYHYYRDRKLIHVKHELDKDMQVHLLGTLALALHTDTMDLSYESFKSKNIADVWLAVEAQNQNVPLIAMARESNWVHHHPEHDYLKTLYHDFHRKQTYPGNAVMKFVDTWRFPAMVKTDWQC